MSRPTVAMLNARCEALDAALQAVKDELAKANRRILALEEQISAAPKPRKKWRPSGTNYGLFAGDACKHFGKKTVSKEEILQYISEVEAVAE